MNRAGFAKAFHVSRETMGRLDIYAEQIQKWSKAINLLGPIETTYLWERHIADCGQLLGHVPDHARTWLDLGSGAGLPGLVVAVAARDVFPDLGFTLVEADKRKSAFLRETSRQTETPVTVISERIEDIAPLAVDVVSARALAPLRRLLRHVARIAPDAGTLLLHKGRNLDAEIDEAVQEWEIEAERIPSRTDPEGTILKITRFSSRA